MLSHSPKSTFLVHIRELDSEVDKADLQRFLPVG